MAGKRVPRSNQKQSSPSDSQQRELVVLTKADVGLRASGDQVASAVGADTSSLTKILKSVDAVIKPMFGDEEQLEAEMASGSAPGSDQPHLAQFYNVEADDDKLDDLAEKLMQSPLVESAYVKPPAELAVIAEAENLLDETETSEAINDMEPILEAPPASPNFTARQGYLNAAPVGVDARYAWAFPGGRGNNVRVIDVEWGWNFTHEDLRQNQGGSIAGGNSSNNNHGTAVIGVIGGDRNNIGVAGISPDAVVSAVSLDSMSTAPAIRIAADRLRAGDIMLLEVHRRGPAANGIGQHGYIAIEWWPDDFAAIRYATRKGVIVVEAAGNGQQNLDAAIYNQRPSGFPSTWRNPFNPANPSSYAVVVGAGSPPPGTHGSNHGPDRSRLGFSNFGRRVDCQGWGREVTTTGYGDLQGGTDRNRWYTDTFSGTSSASPCVVGSLACLQGILRARGMRPLLPAAAISLLRTTGSPQTDAPGRPRSQRIGNRPNLRQMIARYIRPGIKTVPLYRYWKPQGGDHFYTTNFRELGRGRLGYRYEGVQCYILPRYVRGMVPLYRYWNPSNVDHFYTTNFSEFGRGRNGYRYEGILGYVSPKYLSGTVPLYRYWNPTFRDHFYTTNFRELGRGRLGWRYEGIQCYVSPRAVTYAASPEGSSSYGFDPEMGFGGEFDSSENLSASGLNYSADELICDEGTGDSGGFQDMLHRMGIMGADQYDPNIDPGNPEASFDDALEADLGPETDQYGLDELVQTGAEMFEPEALDPSVLEMSQSMGDDSFSVEPAGETGHLMSTDSFTTTAEHEGPVPEDSFATNQPADESSNITINLNLGKK
jgi:hypothetical protein